jgi:hypothetical protein
MNGFTAAHRTLPFNTQVRVTNLSNGQSALVRITDRGPFIADRVIDVSYAAAKQIDMWRQGTARVKIDVLSSPVDVSAGGRWAVQIGAFTDADSAAKVKGKLERRYRTASVLQYAGPTHHWWARATIIPLRARYSLLDSTNYSFEFQVSSFQFRVANAMQLPSLNSGTGNWKLRTRN